FVTVHLWDRNPVAQPIGVGLVFFGYHGIGNPAIGLFIFGLGIQNNADSKQIHHLVEGNTLLVHLIVNRKDGLCACFHGKPETSFFKFDFDGFYKLSNEVGSLLFGLLQAVHHIIVVIGLLEFKA